MLKSSLVYSLFYTIINYLCFIISNSILWKIIIFIHNKVRNFVIHSFIYNFVYTPSRINRWFKLSFCYRLYNFLLQAPINAMGKGYKSLALVIEQSLIFKLMASILARLHLLIGFFLLILFIIPYNQWNNLYALGAIIGFTLLFTIKAIMNTKIQFDTKMVNIFSFLFALSVLIAFITSIDPVSSLKFLIFYINGFLLTLLIVSEIDSKKKLIELLNIILFGIFLTSIYGIYQWIQGIPISQSQMDVSISTNLVGRVYSTIGNANNYAEVLVLTLPFLAALFFDTDKIKEKLYYVVITLPCLLALLLTYSRSSWIGLAVAVMVYIAFINWRLIPTFIVLGLAAFPFMPASIKGRILTIFSGDSSTTMRMSIWKETIPMVKDYWTTGMGLGSDLFVRLIKNYPVTTRFVHSHNVFMQILLETGIVGFVSFIGMHAYMFKETLINWKNNNADRKNHFIIASISAIVGFLVVGLVEYVWHDHRVMLAYFMVLGLLMASLKNSND